MSRRTPKSTSFSRVEKFAMKYPDAERSHYFGKPAIKVGGQMIACMASHQSAEPDTLVVRVDFLDRDLRIANEPEVYYLKPHYVNYPCVLTRLAKASDAALEELLDSSYRFVANAKKKKKKKKKAK